MKVKVKHSQHDGSLWRHKSTSVTGEMEVSAEFKYSLLILTVSERYGC